MLRLFKRGPVEHRANYSNAAVDSLLTVAAGGSADPTTTASVETAIRALSAPYGLASVMGPAMITPALLADLARRLFTSGNAVYRIQVINEDLSLVPASSFDVGGSAGRWVYQLDTPIPGQSRLHRQIVPADGVIHVRINASASEPWRGRAPWQLAKVSASTLAYIERSLESDVMVRSAILLPCPTPHLQLPSRRLSTPYSAAWEHSTSLKPRPRDSAKGTQQHPAKTGCKSGLGRWSRRITSSFGPSRPRRS